MSIPDEKLSLILELFINQEMSKSQTIRAIQRLAANACEETKSEERANDRRKQTSYPQANQFERWNQDDEQRLMSLRAQGYGYDIIARELRRTTRSVRTKYLEVRQREAVQAQQKAMKMGSK